MRKQPTKNNLIMILDILKKHSDVNHRLTQKDIQNYLKSDYDFVCDRKTVKRNLMNLVEYGFDIEYSEISRSIGTVSYTDKNCTQDNSIYKVSAELKKSRSLESVAVEDVDIERKGSAVTLKWKAVKGAVQYRIYRSEPSDETFEPIDTVDVNDNIIITDIYYNHAFEDSEVKLISDSLLFSKYILARETKRLIEKVEEQASPFAKNMLKNSVNFETLGNTENAQIFYTVELLNQAINEGRQVKFYYCEYGLDKKLHRRHDFKQTVNPYYTVTSGGRYYLIGNVDKFSNLANFRIDKITDIELCDAHIKSIRKLDGCEHGFNLSDYMKEHLYMFSGETVHARLEVDTSIIGQIIDWYGKEFDVISDDGERCVISLTVNENALFYWAMQYGRFVKVLSPQRVADRILETVRRMAERYGEE